MPDFNKIYEAAFADDVKALKELMAEGGNPNTAYEGYAESIKSVLGNFCYYGKRIFGGTSAGTGALLVAAGTPAALGAEAAVAAAAAGAGAVAAAPITLTGVAVMSSVLILMGAGSWFSGNDRINQLSFNKNGWTALHFAAAGNALRAIPYLIDKGIDATVADHSGRTCSDIATALGYKGVNKAIIDGLQEKAVGAKKQVADATRKVAEATAKTIAAKKESGVGEAKVLAMLEGMLKANGVDLSELMRSAAAESSAGAGKAAAPFHAVASAGADKFPMPAGKIEYIPEDGNCLFHAVAFELDRQGVGTYTHQQLRVLAVNYLREHPDILEEYPPERESASDYLERMAKDKKWGDGLVIRALCDALNLRITTWTENLVDNMYGKADFGKNQHGTSMHLLLTMEDEYAHYNVLILGAEPVASPALC